MPKSVHISIELPEGLYWQLESVVAASEPSLSRDAVIGMALWMFLQQITPPVGSETEGA